MPPRPLLWKLLLVDDDQDDYIIFKDLINQARGGKVALEWASSYEAGEQMLNANHYDAVFVDYYLGRKNGIKLIRRTIERKYPAPIILLTGCGSYEVDLEAMNAGATFYLTKDEINPMSLERFIRYAIERKRIEDDLAESEAKYRSLAESIHDGLIELDRDWRFIYLNQRAASDVGYAPEKLIGKNIWETFPDILGMPLEQHYHQVMEQRQPASFEMAVAATGSWYLIRVYPSTEGISVFWIDITQNKKTEEALRDHKMQIELHHRLLEHREQERQSIARDLHDGPIQDLLAMLMEIRHKQDTITDPEMQNELNTIELRLNTAIQGLRDLINEIRPPYIIRFGLAKAMQLYLDDFKCQHPEIELTISIMDASNCLPEQARISLFRILQEALTNAIKHSHTKRIEVNWSQQEDQCVLKISDEGQGFIVSESLIDYSSYGHYGLVGMKERAEAIGGKLSITSKPGAGTTIMVVIPEK